MVGELQLRCVHPNAGSEDRVHFVDQPRGRVVPRPAISIDTYATGQSRPCSTWIDEDQARELFNWLGVWLHGR